MARAGPPLEAGKRRLVRRAPGKDDEPAATSCARGLSGIGCAARRDDDLRGDPAPQLDLILEEQRALGIRLGRGVADELSGSPGQLEQQLAVWLLEDRPQLDEIGDERVAAGRSGQPPVGERHGHARALVRDPELRRIAASRGSSSTCM